MTLRDYGRVGQFILDGGQAGGRQVTPDWWVAQATTKQIENGTGGYGYFWWIRPTGSYDASGIFGQSITTYRDERLIIVSNAAWPRATGRDLSAARTAFNEAIRAAAKGL
jgi:CubicO group peptidase (beta-lactamase class C family)